MRLILLELDSKVDSLLSDIAKLSARGDIDYVRDLYSLLRLKGQKCIPTDAAVDKIAKAYSTALKTPLVITRTLLRKRRQIITDLLRSVFFTSYIKREKKGIHVNLIDEVEQWLVTMQLFAKRVKQAQCMTCNLKSQCDFGKQYGDQVSNITGVIDEEWDKLVHTNCPERPAITAENEAFVAMRAAAKMAQQEAAAAVAASAPSPDMINDPSATAGDVKKLVESQKEAEGQSFEELSDSELDDLDDLSLLVDDDSGDLPGLTSLGDAVSELGAMSRHDHLSLVKTDYKVINKLSMAQLSIFELAQKLDLMLEKNAKGKKQNTNRLSKDRKQRSIETVSDIAKVSSQEHALPEDAFNAKLSKKSLNKKQNLKGVEKRKLIYLLIDVSGSMFTFIGGTALGYMTRDSLARCFSLAIARRFKIDGGYVFCRLFESDCSRLAAARTSDQFPALERFITDNTAGAGGTNIHYALATALGDISAAKSELSEAEILMITDGECRLSKDQIIELQTKSKDIAIHVLDLNTAGTSDDAFPYARDSSDRFKKTMLTFCDQYFKFDHTASSLDKMVSMVGAGKHQRK